MFILFFFFLLQFVPLAMLFSAPTRLFNFDILQDLYDSFSGAHNFFLTMYGICHIYVVTSVLFYPSYKYLYLMQRKEKSLPYTAEEV